MITKNNFYNQGVSLVGVIITILTVVLISGGLYYYLENQIPEGIEIGKESSEEKLLPDETANWNIYRNEEFGFEIKYPMDKTPLPDEPLGEHPNRPRLLFRVTFFDSKYGRTTDRLSGTPAMEIYVSKCSSSEEMKECLGEFVDLNNNIPFKNYDKYEGKIIHGSGFTLDGYPGEKIEVVRTKFWPGEKDSGMVVKRDNLIYMILFLTSSDNYETVPQKIGDSILSTFRFTGFPTIEKEKLEVTASPTVPPKKLLPEAKRENCPSTALKNYTLSQGETPSGFELVIEESELKAYSLLSNPGLIDNQELISHLYNEVATSTISEVCLSLYIRPGGYWKEGKFVLSDDLSVIAIRYNTSEAFSRELQKVQTSMEENTIYLKGEKILIMVWSDPQEYLKSIREKVAEDLKNRLNLEAI